MSSESYEGVALFDDRGVHAAIVRVSSGLTGHVVALEVQLDDGFGFDVHRPLVASDRRLLRGEELNARPVDEHERSFELSDHQGRVIGSLRLGQRVIVDGEARETAIRRVLLSARAAAA